MKSRIILFLIITLSLSFSIQAQRNCGSMDYLNNQIQEDPKRQHHLDELEHFTQNWIKNNQNSKSSTLITIPVVFHVVYRTSTENISTAQLESQLTVLNDDFRRLNADQNNKWSQAADTEIEFCLATTDPNGNPTSGITRTSTSVNGHGTNDSVKFNSSGGKDAWPASDYLNFWVCNIGGGILGYAQFPGGPASTDGVVCGYQYVGTIGTATSPFDLGRTATHEVGHWLNLRHIWGDGNCNQDDFVSDTPTSDGANYGCASSHVSCGSLDMVENYMDYSDDACMNLYTLGQKDRMQALFGSGGFRASLLNSAGCGGTPPPPPPGCNDNEITVSISLDNYPSETSWDLKNSSGSVVASGGTYGGQANGSTVNIDECLVDGCYDFTIYDSYGDGICCGYGNGSYTVLDGATVLASGGNFGYSETTNFCLGSPSGPSCSDGIQNQGETGVDCGGPCPACAPTCSDGIQNQGETGVDCGGPCPACAPTCSDGIQNQGETGVDCGGPCPACAPTCSDGIQNQGETGIDCGGPCTPCGGGPTVLSAHYFESGWDGWQDGGSDCYRYSGSRSWEGSRSIRIRDNSGTKSAMTSSTYNLSSYSSVDVEFYFYSYSMENGEDFWLRYYDGSSWNTVASYARGTNFNNNTFYVATVTISNGSYNFPSNAKFRFQCDASANGDHIYIDAVTITASGNGSRVEQEVVSDIQLLEEIDDRGELEEEMEISLYPNPASDIVIIESNSEIENLEVFSINGQRVFSSNNNEYEIQINVSEFEPGVYLVKMKTAEQTVTKRLLIN